MKWLNHPRFIKLFVYPLCGLSVCVNTMQANAQEEFCEQEECHASNWHGAAAFGLGAVIAGGAALLATSHKDGSSGPKGHTGSPGFVNTPDPAQTLTFNFVNFELTLNAISTIGFTGTVILKPFVRLPDGSVVVGQPQTFADFNFSNLFVVSSLEPITVSNPFFGEYSPGVEVIVQDQNETIKTFSLQLQVNVGASRDNSNTITLERAVYNLADFNGLAVPPQFQIVTDYTYNTANIP